MPSESTLKQYAMRMDILKKAGINIRNPSEVFRWFETNEYGLSSQKVYISAIQHTLGDEVIPEYKNKIKSIFETLKKKESQQLLSEKQEKNFVKWDELMEVQQKLAGMEKTTAKWKQYLVVSLYTLNAPVRADYGEMEIHTKYDKNRTGNELIWNKTPKFIFRKYKTAKGYGEVKIPVSKPLQKVIGEWFEYLGKIPTYLLGETASSPNTFAVYIASTFQKYTGKEVGVSLIRHAYITHIYPSLRTLVQKEELARRMLHSTDRQERYISIKDMD